MHNTINLYKIQAFTKKISILSQVKKLTKYMITNGIISSLITSGVLQLNNINFFETLDIALFFVNFFVFFIRTFWYFVI